MLAMQSGAAEAPVVSQNPANCLRIPDGPDALASYYDLTLSHPATATPAFSTFERWLAQAAARRGLTCALLHEGVVEEASWRLYHGQLSISFHLDYFALWHVSEDRYARLAQAVQDAGGRPINAPARSRLFTDKAACHMELLHRGLGVPATVLLRPWAPDRTLTARERMRLQLDEPGTRVYVKPANGFGSHGVMRLDRLDSDSLRHGIAAVRAQAPQETYLVQREVCCPLLVCEDGMARPAYWRILYCLGEWFPFWWNKHEPEHGRPSYRPLTRTEIERHGLEPVLDYAAELAALTELDWFSTELCLSQGTEPSCHVVQASTGQSWPVIAIDYINDQCDVDVQSRWLGAPPDETVRRVAERFAEAARWEKRHHETGYFFGPDGHRARPTRSKPGPGPAMDGGSSPARIALSAIS